MSMVALWLLQAAVPGGAAAFDLRKLPASRAAEGCAAATGDEIVVCARPDETVKHRIETLPPTPVEPLLPKAEMKLFGDGVGSLVTDGVTLPDGTPSNRVMVRVKIPF